MKMSFSFFTLSLLFASSAFSSDIMVERMQSVIDEVSDLRERYESSVQKNSQCQIQLQEQNKVIKKISRGEGLDYKVFEENRKRLRFLEEENKKLKVSAKAVMDTKALEKELSILEKENKRIKTSAQILAEKNRALGIELTALKSTQRAKEVELIVMQEEIKHLNASIEKQKLTLREAVPKSEHMALKLENSRLQKELTSVHKKVSKPQQPTKVKTICSDDNPFPKLMAKGDSALEHPRENTKPLEDINKAPLRSKVKSIIRGKASAYRVKLQSKIYNLPNGEVMEVWDEQTSFTSNISQGEWIKVTGYFKDKKWRRATEELWVKAEDTVKR